MTSEIGYIHSLYTGSVVDGPGVRTVLWTTGCLMRCQYCHNPDTWIRKNGQPMSVDQVMHEIAKYRRFLSITRGGVTISGGEPLLQARFVCSTFRACEQLGIHTALDTNGYLGHRLSDQDLDNIDLVMLDLKSFDPDIHRRTTGVDVEPVLQFARRLSERNHPTWIRFVLVPGLTCDEANVDGLAGFVSTLRNVERVEVLPFHQLGRAKWERLGRAYPLHETLPPDQALMERVAQQFRAAGLETG